MHAVWVTVGSTVGIVSIHLSRWPHLLCTQASSRFNTSSTSITEMAWQEVESTASRSMTVLSGISMSHGEHKLQVGAKQLSGYCCLRSIGKMILHSFFEDRVFTAVLDNTKICSKRTINCEVMDNCESVFYFKIV